MKNKRSMIIVIAMVLLLAVVLGMGGTTFAKYVSSRTFTSTTAKVAKWGYTFDVQADDLFASDYSGKTLATKVANGTGVSVKASAEAIAPGTTGSMTFNINANVTEVAADITFDAVVNNDVKLAKTDATANAVALDEDYYPVKWTVQWQGDDASKKTYANLTALDTNINNDFKYSVAAGATSNKTLVVSWEWTFENGDKDAADTLLGQAIAGTKSLSASTTQIDFTLTATVTQAQNDAP